MTQLYNYDKDTAVYFSTTTAKLDPIDGSTRIPALCTTTAVISVEEGEVAVWNGSAWVATEDHRGEEYWLSAMQTEAQTCNFLGALPEGATSTQPALTTEEASGLQRATRDALLDDSDKRAMPDNITDVWIAYRAALRDVPTQSGFPNSITWPTKPT